jgi:hypothetical protein
MLNIRSKPTDLDKFTYLSQLQVAYSGGPKGGQDGQESMIGSSQTDVGGSTKSVCGEVESGLVSSPLSRVVQTLRLPGSFYRRAELPGSFRPKFRWRAEL